MLCEQKSESKLNKAGGAMLSFEKILSFFIHYVIDMNLNALDAFLKR